MKVAIVTAFPSDPLVPRGGVEAVSVTLTQALAKLTDLDLHVVTIDQECPTPTRIEWENATIHRLPRLGRWMLSSATGPDRRQVSAYLHSLAPDVVHAHDTYGLMVKGLRLPRVFTIHGFIYGDTRVSEQRVAWLRSRLWHWVETSGWADQPYIISISPYVRERLTGITTGIIHDIDNPIAESFFHIARNERKGTIFSAAMICPRKNTLGLIDAFARLCRQGYDAELRLAGAVTDVNYGHRVSERIREYSLTDRVKMLGGISSKQVGAELAAASIFALVSLEENAPLGIEEAMAVGVPVVTSNRCGMPYMVRHGETGFLVNPHDPEDIARRFHTLLADDAMRAAMYNKARHVAEERFHPTAVAGRTREVYLQAVRERGSAAQLGS